MAANALELPGIIVTADPTGRAKGELGTASVIDREAIANQSATSLRGILELVPGVALQPPGIDRVEQIALRAVPTGRSASFTAGGPTGADIASLGTLIILDGVPVSNNANLQTTGPRGELQIPSSAGGGVDLRRFPASTIERVEVIRGVPSARYGDLTQGVIIVDTRAGTVEPTFLGRYDERTGEASLTVGPPLSEAHEFTTSLDVTRTALAPGLSEADSYRLTAQLIHRAAIGRTHAASQPALTFDSHADFFLVREDNPEQPELFPGRASFARDRGFRFSERVQVLLGGGSRVGLTSALDYVRQESSTQALVVRGATPFTDRLTQGRQEGRFVLGRYLARVGLDGEAWQLYNRLEAEVPVHALGMSHLLLAGAELRREWNTGAGFQFDIEFPPQVTFNGVQGFDRPRPFDAVPPVATSSLYIDDRLRATLAGVELDLQTGLRLDILHRGPLWFSGARDAVFQPRVNIQLSPTSWLRLRAGAGRTAKLPSVGQLHPAPQYFDIVNVNWFPPDPGERVAVLSTFIRDPSNPDLGYSTGRKLEAGVEVGGGRKELSLGIVAFSDRTTGGVGIRQDPAFLVRDLFDLADSMIGTGVQPTVVEPPMRADTVPILLDRLANVLTLASEGIELTATLPQIGPLRLQLSVTGSLIRTRFFSKAIDFGRPFREFQVNSAIPRSPYWESTERRAELGILTYRLVHHQPELGLVVTAVIEHFFHDVGEVIGGSDTLSFAGYITRTGDLVPVALAQRGDPEFADLRVARVGFTAGLTETPADWLASLEVRKTLPFDGHLSFFAFNVFDRLGRFVTDSRFSPRTFPSIRFGIEVTMPLGPLWPGKPGW